MADRPRIRSFVLRQGRLTSGQRKALERLWPVFGLEVEAGRIDLAAVFACRRPVCLEIGFGMGDSLAQQARRHPDRNYIGVEVHRPGVGHLLLLIEKFALQNLRIYAQDSVDVLERAIPDGCLDVIQLFFPDPWPKKRHHKRRLIDAGFVLLLRSKLQDGGLIHIATDWPPYAREIAGVFAHLAEFVSEPPPDRPITRFELRGRKLGHEITDLAFRLVKQQQHIRQEQLPPT